MPSALERARAQCGRSRDAENRDWPPPRAVVGHRIAIHQKALDEDALRHVQDMCDGRPTAEEVVLGAFLGTVVLHGYVLGARGRVVEHPGLTAEETRAALQSKWRNPQARCLWVLRDPVALAKPTPCRGMQKLWRVPAEHVAALEART